MIVVRKPGERKHVSAAPCSCRHTEHTLPFYRTRAVPIPVEGQSPTAVTRVEHPEAPTKPGRPLKRIGRRGAEKADDGAAAAAPFACQSAIGHALAETTAAMAASWQLQCIHESKYLKRRASRVVKAARCDGGKWG